MLQLPLAAAVVVRVIFSGWITRLILSPPSAVPVMVGSLLVTVVVALELAATPPMVTFERVGPQLEKPMGWWLVKSTVRC